MFIYQILGNYDLLIQTLVNESYCQYACLCRATILKKAQTECPNAFVADPFLPQPHILVICLNCFHHNSRFWLYSNKLPHIFPKPLVFSIRKV